MAEKAAGGLVKKQPDFTDKPRLKRSLGQNFLKNEHTARRIVEALDIQPGDYVLEIGPGAGALSRHICSEPKPAGLLLLEKDAHWAFGHAENCAAAKVNCLPLNIDALTFAWERLDFSEKTWKIAGNLPYNIASPLLWDLAARGRKFERAVVMVQKEVAQRITATPGNKIYGALSVWLQSFVAPRKIMDVPPTAFYPMPKVWSQVLELKPRPDRYAGNQSALAELLKICFQKRRKQLGTILAARLNESVHNHLESRGLSLTSRPEELSPHAFQGLAEVLFPGQRP